MPEFTLRIDGMHCGSCIRRVGQALNSTGGLIAKEVRVGAARVETHDQISAIDRAVAALAKAGYTAHPESESSTIHMES